MINKLLVLTASLQIAWLIHASSLPPVPAPLPVVSLDAIDPETAAEIREIERGHKGTPLEWLQLTGIYRTWGLLPQSEYCYVQIPEGDLQPNDWYYRGVTLSRMGRLKSAAAMYQRAIKAGSSLTPHCWLMLGRDALRAEKPEAAEPMLEKAGDLPAAQIMLARLRMHEGRAEEALPVLRTLIKKYPESLSGHQKLAWAYEETGDTSKAWAHELRTLHSFDRFSPHGVDQEDDNERMKLLGVARLVTEAQFATQAGNQKKAATLLERALENSWIERFALQLGQIQLASGNIEEAKSTALRCIKTDGASAESLLLLGQAQFTAGDSSEAQRSWERAAKLPASRDASANMQAFELLTRLHEDQGHVETARRHRALASWQRGRLLFRQNDLPKALREFETAAAVLTEHKNTLLMLGEVRLALGDTDGAIDAWQQCLQHHPNCGRAMQRLNAVSAPE